MTGPIGLERADVHAATVATVIANANRGPKTKSYKVKDFIPDWDRRPQTTDQQLATVYQLNAVFGGTVKGRDNGDS